MELLYKHRPEESEDITLSFDLTAYVCSDCIHSPKSRGHRLTADQISLFNPAKIAFTTLFVSESKSHEAPVEALSTKII